MGEIAVAFLGVVIGWLIGIAPSMVDRLKADRVRSAARAITWEYDKSPKAVLARLCGCDKEHITVRPLIPEDVEKTDWNWRDNEAIRTSTNRLLELTGINCSQQAVVSLFNNEVGSIRVGLLTSWDNTASVIIKPTIPVYLRLLEIGGEKSSRFALRGRVYEPEGAYIV